MPNRRVKSTLAGTSVPGTLMIRPRRPFPAPTNSPTRISALFPASPGSCLPRRKVCRGTRGASGRRGETDALDFLSRIRLGKPVPLHTEFSATVDGTNGNTLLHPVRATLVRSLIVAEGSVIQEPRNRGHTIVVNFSAPNARIQDILRLAVDSDKPFLTGTVRITGKLVVPPSPAKALEKLILDGEFGLDDARWSSQEVRGKLQALSRRAEGKPADEDAGSAVSGLRGNFT